MEKALLENILDDTILTVKEFEEDKNYSRKIMEAYDKKDIYSTIRNAYTALNGISDKISKSENVKTIGGMQKLVNYNYLYLQVSALMAELYNTNNKTDNSKK